MAAVWHHRAMSWEIHAQSHRVTPIAWSDRLGVLLGEYHCPPNDPAWGDENDAGVAWHMVFTGTPVEIIRARTGPVTTDRNLLMLYDRNESYRRRVIDPRGDHCLFLALGTSIIDQLPEPARAMFDPRTLRFRQPAAVSSATTYLRVQQLSARLRDLPPDPLAVEEDLAELVRLSTSSLLPSPIPPPGSTRDAVEALKRYLALNYAENLTLTELASIVHVSPFHLHRVFREATGMTIHTYREQLRLRAGVEQLLIGHDDLAALANDLGFSSHSHFSARFKKSFDRTPSEVRDAA